MDSSWSLADTVAFFHLLFVLFVTMGEFYILVGAAFNFPGIKNFTFRIAHIAAIGFVVFESIFQIACPLTVLEYELRNRKSYGQEDGGFIANLVQKLLYYNFSPIVFDILYLLFGLLVLLTWVSIPPRRRKKNDKETSTHRIH